MAGAPRVLFVLFEGLADTVIDSQVLDHAREVARAGAGRFEIWAYACSDELYARSRVKREAAEKRAEAPVRVFRGVRPAWPGSGFLNARRLAAAMTRYSPGPDVLHARTDYTAAVCGRLPGRDSFRLIWDCRGDAVAEMAARAETAEGVRRALYRQRARAMARIRNRAAQACDRAAFVSRPLLELGRPLIGDKRAIVAPCAASEERFFFDPELRRSTRARLGYGETDKVFVYSGSLAPYQCFEETVALFASIRAGDRAARLLVLCPDVEGALQRAAGLDPDALTVLAAPHEAVNGYLNAADIAFMLRRTSPLNHVASPTKFAEYCLTGLSVVMTDAVHDAVAQARALGNLLPANLTAGTLSASAPSRERAGLAAEAKRRLGKTGLVPLYRELYAGTPAGGA